MRWVTFNISYRRVVFLTLDRSSQESHHFTTLGWTPSRCGLCAELDLNDLAFLMPSALPILCGQRSKSAGRRTIRFAQMLRPWPSASWMQLDSGLLPPSLTMIPVSSMNGILSHCSRLIVPPKAFTYRVSLHGN